MSKPLLIFDWDGVLFNTESVMAESYRRVVAKFGLPMPDAAMLRSFIGPTDEENAKSLGIQDPAMAEAFAKALWEIEYALIFERGELYDGVVEMIRSLRDKATLCVVSNGGYNHVHAGLVKFDLLPLFEDITTARAKTPKSESFRRLMREFAHEGVIAVGDRAGDINAGLEAGAYCIGAAYGFGGAEELAGAAKLAHSVAELTKLLQNAV